MDKSVYGPAFLAGILAACAAAPGYSARTLTVSVQTPNPCWRVEVTAVYRTADALLAVSRLSPPGSDTLCAQVIATATDSVTLQLPPLPVQYLVLGKTWDWGAGAGYQSVDSRADLQRRLQGAELLFRRGEPRTTPGGGVL